MIKKIVQKILNIIFPKTCLICNKIINGGQFCAEDWNKLHFLQKPACDICFEPFEFKTEDKMICGQCILKKPDYFKAISVLKYDQASSDLIVKFKYFDQINLTKYFSNLMFKQAEEIIGNIDFIIPVPLHKLKIIKRKYNQSALLAKNIALIANKKLIPDLLIRIKNSKPQASLNRGKRQKNVAGIFQLKEKYLKEIKGKNILLIDDVKTTGSTVNSCSKALKKAGVNRVYVLTLARTSAL